jgi:two-component system, response regulator YesN
MDKIRMILADDEPVILRGLRMIIDWDELGVEIVGEAYDGNELITLLDTCDPELIVSDICMPGCSGIDVLRHIKLTGQTAKVVFVSAYKEFSYAQDALKYGALDYLVKPVNTSQLEQVIQKAVSLIRDESEEERNRKKLEHLERNIHNKTIEELLDQLTDGDGNAARVLNETLGFSKRKHAAVCVGEWSRVLPKEGRWEEREKRLVDFAVTNVMIEIVKKTSDCFFFRKGRTFCFLMMYELPEQPVQIAREIREHVSSYLKINMTFGVGGDVADVEQAVISYKQALEALEWAYFNGPGTVIPYQPPGEEPGAQLHVAEIQAKLLQEIVTASPDADPKQTLAQLLAAIKHVASGNKHTAVSTVYTTLMTIQQELKSMDISLEWLNGSFHSLLEQLSGLDTLLEVEIFIQQLITGIHQQVKARLGNKEQAQIKQVKEYIEINYSQNITLEKISGLIFMNPSYFSTFFKKHTGENYKQYLTEVRMKHARRLLLQADYMVYEVAEKVGYNNARLFSEIFRKRFGQIPHEYKLSKGRQTNEPKK